MKKNVVILFILISSNLGLFAQVGGISASKLATICADPVPNKIIEFEPAFGFGFSEKYYDENGKLSNSFASSDSIEYFSEFGFRLTYGVIENLEIGTSFPVDMSSISWGTKYMLNQNDMFRTSILAGINLPIGNTVLNKNERHYDTSNSYAFGVASTVDISDKTGFDFDLQAQKLFTESAHNLDFFANFDYSYWITEEFQAILGLNYSKAMFENYNEELLCLNVGATIERHENFLLVINSPIDLYGKNVQHIFGLGFALTISIN